MEKFKRQPGETVLLKGSVAYIQGEPGLKNFLKGKTTVTECTGILTSKRFVACKKRKFFPWGPLIWLFIVLSKRKIVFAIPLGSFASIQYDKEAKKHLLFKTSDGSEYRLAWTGLFDKPEKWVRAITDAVLESSPGTKSQATEVSVDFVRPS
ncbi:MAG: hypothetical protein HYY65_10705 [Candidatus Tectomicrobia bacterium]|uniref:PH domain-containing protein n=1 Tax=Tectimicrobiota bacterium TaxID=2528274 RepID=A0A932M239_UNCTE|nr:hypothetical protein [Candidatus Tectomicrobia bacterium]